MKVYALVALAILSLVTLVHSESKSAELGQKKLDELLKKSRDTGLLHIVESEFDRYISRGPRPYYSLIVLTAVKSGSCKPCEHIAPEIEKLGKLVQDQRNEEDEENLQVFVMEVDFLDNRETFRKLGLSTAPMIVLIPPTKTRKEIPLSKFFKTIGPKYVYTLTGGREAEAIGDWIAKTAKIPLSFGGGVDIPDLRYVILIAVVGLSSLYFLRSFIDRARKSMMLYAVVCCGVYAFVIGGGMFNFIRDTPWAHKEGSRTVYFSHMSRYQFQAEGYSLGLANLIAAVCAYLYIVGQKDGIERDEKGRVIARHKLVKMIPVGFMLIGMILAAYFILYIYNFKNPHYNMGHVGMLG